MDGWLETPRRPGIREQASKVCTPGTRPELCARMERVDEESANAARLHWHANAPRSLDAKANPSQRTAVESERTGPNRHQFPRLALPPPTAHSCSRPSTSLRNEARYGRTTPPSRAL